MIVVDPVALGDVTFWRASSKWVFDRAGTLVQVPADVPAVTYDPADLSKAPYVHIEPSATNLLPYSNDFANAAWAKNDVGIAAQVEPGIDGQLSAIRLVENAANAIHELRTPGLFLVAGQTYTMSVFAKAGSRQWLRVGFSGVFGSTTYATFDLSSGTVGVTSNSDAIPFIESAGSGWYRCCVTYTVKTSAGGTNYVGIQDAAYAPSHQGNGGGNLLVSRAQLEVGSKATSSIVTQGGTGTRAADVVGATAGLLFSNVAESEPLWAAGSYAKGAKVRNEAHVAFESLVDANTAPLTDKTKWLSLGATNRHAMFDDRNNTQTSNAEEVIVVLSPRAIAQGLLLGNLDASEVAISVTVPNFGVVYRETASLIMSTSNSSFFRWGFNRIRRKTLFLSLSLPIFFNGVVTLTIRRPGGVAKCGMCLIGPTVEPGPTLLGLSTEIKDYSTTIFNTDGSSETTPRGYRKLMSMDVLSDTEKIVEAEDQMIAWRQKTVVWIGAASRPDTIIVGRYSSFKKVIESYPRSKMALQIEGVLS